MPVARRVETDYLIVGAGALGMTFADQLLTDTDASIVIVDRHHMPGGHWNDAYPFVRLHQPSAFYGAGSRQLGSNRIEAAGFNRGYFELASGSEVLNYFDARCGSGPFRPGVSSIFRCLNTMRPAR
jgi:cation diffusion facilitator CzcD-associated flavoprotein CzcO